MHQITADEFCVIKGNLTFRLTRFFHSCGKSNLIFRDRKNPAVGNGDPVGITSKIFNGIAKSVEGFLDVGTPVLFIKTVFPFFPVVRIAKLFTGG